MFALPATFLVRWRGWVIAAWAALALLFAPRASHVQQVLALRGGASETTEAARATDLLKQAFPSPFADYVAIVVHGPVRWTNQRFERVLDTLKAVAERQSYVSQIISVRSIGESSFVSPDRRTTFLIAALTPEFTSDISKSIVPDLRAAIRDAMGRVPGADGFAVMVTGFPALDHNVRTISAEDSERGERRVLALTLVVMMVAFGAVGDHVGFTGGGRVRGPPPAAAFGHALGGGGRTVRRVRRGAVGDDISPRRARRPGPQHRSPQMAGPPAREVSRPHGVGALGPLAGPPPVARGGRGRHRGRPARLPGHADPARTPRDELVPAGVRVWPGPGRAPGDGGERRDPAHPRGRATARRTARLDGPLARRPQGAHRLRPQGSPRARGARRSERPAPHVHAAAPVFLQRPRGGAPEVREVFRRLPEH